MDDMVEHWSIFIAYFWFFVFSAYWLLEYEMESSFEMDYLDLYPVCLMNFWAHQGPKLDVILLH